MKKLAAVVALIALSLSCATPKTKKEQRVDAVFRVAQASAVSSGGATLLVVGTAGVVVEGSDESSATWAAVAGLGALGAVAGGILALVALSELRAALDDEEPAKP